MKRCPQCNRVETDEALKFCRVDGATLVNDSSSIAGEEGTAQLHSAAANEIETSILPYTTGADISRATAATTVLAERQQSPTTRALTQSSRRGVGIVIGIVAVVFVGLAIYAVARYYSHKSSNAIDSIVVVPFQNASANTDTEYLSDGIAESLINSLTQLHQLRVIARATAFRYKGKDIDPQAVGRELNVRAVLMGRVRQSGDALDVQVDLVDAQTGAQLWGEEYERKLSEIVNVKQAIAREVTQKLRLRLSGEQQQQLIKHDTKNADAYQSYLKGRFYWNKRTAADFRKAIDEFQQAIDRDPNYALGYVGLADCYLLLEDYGGVPPSETLPKAEAAVQSALQLDDSLSEAHTSLAKLYSAQWRWAESEKEFRRAVDLNPNYPTAHHWFSSAYYRPKLQLDDAVKEAKRAQELDPLSPVITNNLASILNQKGDINSAREQLQKIMELDPRFPNSHDNLGWVHFKQGRIDQAIGEFQQAVEFSGRAGFYLCDLGYAYGVAGRRDEALRILKELEAQYARREATGMSVAGVYAGLGDKDQVFQWLEKDFEKHRSYLSDVSNWIEFDDLHSDPRYIDLLRRMGLTQ